MKIISILIVVPMLVYCIGFLVYQLFKYVFSDEPHYIDDVVFLVDKIVDKCQDLSKEQRMEFLHAVEKMLDEQYNKKNNK